MRILQLCNKIPYPPRDGGSIAMLNLISSLANAQHEITVLAMNTDKHAFPVQEIPGQLRSKITFQYIYVDTRIKPIRLIRNLCFSREPYNAERFLSKTYECELQKLLLASRFDLIQLEGLYLKPYISAIRSVSPSSLIVYRAHNVEYEIWENLSLSGRNPLRSSYLKNLAQRIRSYEADMINRYDLLLPISQSDADQFSQMGNTKPVCVFPTGFQPEDFKAPSPAPASADLFFIGALDWYPNQEGLQWFLQAVWPRLQQRFPKLRMHIAGRNAPEWLAILVLRAGADYHGEVESAKQFMDSHTIMVTPLFAGSGLRIKIIEAMARSKVVVTTTKGAQGLATSHPDTIRICDTAESMITEIEHLIQHPDQCATIAQNAFTFASDNYNSQTLTGKLLDFYSKHLGI